MILVGIPPDNYPTGIAKQVLVDFVLKTYPGHVAPEIIKAFEMAINRQFSDVDYDQLLKHYGTFSAEFLARIMAVYNDQERSRQLALQMNKQPNYKQPEVDKYLSYEMGLFKYYDQYRETKKFTMFVESAAFYYGELKELGLITDTKEERQEFGLKARAKTQIKTDRLGRVTETQADHNRRILNCAKAMMLEEWFKGEDFNDTNIRALIGPLINKTV